MSSRTTTIALWIIAFVLTVILALFQRMTGPSYPKRGETLTPEGTTIDYRLPRSHGGEGGLKVRLAAPEGIRHASLEWRRYPTSEPWSSVTMSRAADDGELAAIVPHQPPAGKVEYRLVLDTAEGEMVIPSNEPVVARFRAGVPAWVLIPHILAMFSSMLVSTRALLEVLRPSTPEPRLSVVLAMVLLVFGGLFLGPVVQKFAFGAYWTGWPQRRRSHRQQDAHRCHRLAARDDSRPAQEKTLGRRRCRLDRDDGDFSHPSQSSRVGDGLVRRAGQDRLGPLHRHNGDAGLIHNS